MYREEGFINVDKMLHDIGVEDTDIMCLKYESSIKHLFMKNSGKFMIHFDYGGVNYFYKYNQNTIPYNELIAAELAEDFGIDCVSYDLAVLNGKRGVISANYKKENAHYFSGSDLLYDVYDDIDVDLEKYNNLGSIWEALEVKYETYSNKREIVYHLMQQIVNMFIFDIISCQYDRHSDNWEIVEDNDNINLAPIYDNEGILATSGKNSFVAMTMDENRHDILWKVLKKFQNISSEEFSNIIKEKLWIISEENLNRIFQRVEEKTGIEIPSVFKRYYLEEYQKHKNRLEKVLGIEENIRKR